MDRRLAEAEARGDVLLAIALQQARERLPQSPREPVEAQLGVAGQRLADQPSELPVEEAQQPLLAWGEFSVTEGPVQGDQADSPALRHLVHGRELIIDVGRPMIVVERGRPVPDGIGDELPPGPGDEAAGHVV